MVKCVRRLDFHDQSQSNSIYLNFRNLSHPKRSGAVAFAGILAYHLLIFVKNLVNGSQDLNLNLHMGLEFALHPETRHFFSRYDRKEKTRREKPNSDACRGKFQAAA
jgi:hypothetical protein